MKATINIIITTVLLTVATIANAKSWRINNNEAAKPDFVSINAAMSSENVTAGDTLYLDPGTSISGDQTVTKQVTIVGPGYFRTDTPHRFAYFLSNLLIRAAYTKLEGIISNATINVQAQNVTIERSKFTNVCVGYSGSDAKYATIRQSCGANVYGYSSNYNKNISAYCTIENNILIHGSNVIDYLYLPIIRHNYIRETGSNHVFSRLDNATITDNIIINGNTAANILYNVTNSINISNNVMSCEETTYGGINNNKFGYTSEADIFALTGQNDQLYILKDDSPAKGYATDGGDCGPYGGLMPYVAGGLPSGYPYYTKAIVPVKSVNGKVNVSLKIKMQNE